jgi:hypothetical protein
MPPRVRKPASWPLREASKAMSVGFSLRQLKEGLGTFAMSRESLDTVGVRYTGWAALDRDPQKDLVEFTCPRCGAEGMKPARHERTLYHFVDGFLQDVHGETVLCRGCRTSLHIAPIVMVYDQDEKKRFEAVFAEELATTTH